MSSSADLSASLCFPSLAASSSVYVWQQHVCAAAHRGCHGVRQGEGDRGGESTH